ncbi:hypothetical protein MNAN1_001712 [Malassezia nana]|uniref:Uncharacterized protein n=1 Tax=Malassezia nana TaxID=180528 RepID=A0AAF0EHR3_9BASI|nr:hypothetical protein MNAN1_001712 [Malassezia nana]
MSYAAPFLSNPVEDVPDTQLGITFPWEKTTDSTILGGQARFLQLDLTEFESEEDSEGHDWLAQPAGPTAHLSASSLSDVPQAETDTPFDRYEEALLQEHEHKGLREPLRQEHEHKSPTEPLPQEHEAPVTHHPDLDLPHDTPLHNPHDVTCALEGPAESTEAPEAHVNVPYRIMDQQPSSRSVPMASPSPTSMPAAPRHADALGISGVTPRPSHSWEEVPKRPDPLESLSWAPPQADWANHLAEKPVRRPLRKQSPKKAVPTTSHEHGVPPAKQTLKSKASRFFKNVLSSKRRTTLADVSSVPECRSALTSRFPFVSQKSEPNIRLSSTVDPEPVDARVAAPSPWAMQPALAEPAGLSGLRTPPMVPNMLDRQEPSPYYSPTASLAASPPASSQRLSFSSFRRSDAVGASKPKFFLSFFKNRHHEPMSLTRQASNGKLPNCKTVEEPLPLVAEVQRQESLYRSYIRRRSMGSWEEKVSPLTTRPRPPSVVWEVQSPIPDASTPAMLSNEQDTRPWQGAECVPEPMPPAAETAPVVTARDNMAQETLPTSPPTASSPDHGDIAVDSEPSDFQPAGSLSHSAKRLSLGLDTNAWALDLNFGTVTSTTMHSLPHVTSCTDASPDLDEWFSVDHEQASALPMPAHGSPSEPAS